MKQFNDKQKYMIFKIACSLVLCAALMCDMLMVGKILSEEDPWTDQAGIFLGISIILLGAYELLFMGYREVMQKNKYHYAHIAYAVLCFVAGIVSCVNAKNYGLFGIAGIIYLCVPLMKRIISTIKKHTVRKIILNVLIGILIIILIVFTALTIGTQTKESFIIAGVMPSIIIALTCIIYVCSIVLSNFNNNVLKRIIRKTYAGEILFGLLILIIAFSTVIMMIEPAIPTFSDALWYCFMLVTTIGFGDMTAVTAVGRILSIFLGLYGIVVVAIVTSVIVNFYNEVKNVKDEDDADNASAEEPKADEEQPIADANESVEENKLDEQSDEEAKATD